MVAGMGIFVAIPIVCSPIDLPVVVAERLHKRGACHPRMLAASVVASQPFSVAPWPPFCNTSHVIVAAHTSTSTTASGQSVGGLTTTYVPLALSLGSNSAAWTLRTSRRGGFWVWVWSIRSLRFGGSSPMQLPE